MPPSVEPLTASALAGDVCGLDPADFELDRAAAELRADPQLARMMRYRVSQVRVAMALFAGQRAMAEDLLRLLDGQAR